MTTSDEGGQPQEVYTQPENQSEDEEARLICGIKMDTRYPRSIEGILKIVTVPVALLGLIFIIAALFSSAGGFFFFVGSSYVLYVVIVFVIEICIPHFYVFRLIEAVVMFGFAAFFLLSAILNTAFGVSNGNVLLGLGALCGYACAILCVFQGIFALVTWRKYGDGKKGSQPIFAYCF